jgi:predicted kinase
MPKLTMLRGLPASGKTTLARQLVKEAGNCGRINRDDLRAMLFDSAWTGKREEVVIACEKAIANILFLHGMSAVVDDTNLNQKHRDLWSNVAKESGQHFEMKALDADMATCIDRDSKRHPGVGRPVIERLALQNGLIGWGERPIILCDLDGTLADGRHREHLVTGEKKDWDAYFALCGDDSPIEPVFRWVQALSADHTICIVSGRSDAYWLETALWFQRVSMNGLPLRIDHVFMRAASDHRPDTMIKADILKHLPKEKIAFVLDDRPSVIREVWRANGIKVYPVRGACEEF